MVGTKPSSPPCFHCGLASDPAFSALIHDEPRMFCCLGCRAVAQAITEGGLGDFYQFRDAQSLKPEDGIERFDAYDLQEVQSSFVTASASGLKSVKLMVGGISCAACAWLIEHYLEKLNGISSVRVNVATHRCVFDWDSKSIKLSDVFSALHDIGYRPHPGTEAHSQKLRKDEKRVSLLRMGVAGLGMMQVGMVSVALHAGAIQGIDDSTQQFLRWVSLIFAIPVVFFSAKPFFINAWRSLTMRHLNMDVPVSLALFLAFAASVLGTFTNTGEVYFDSVSMFTFFLLVGRYLEMRARHTSVYETEKLTQLLPVSAERFNDNHDTLELVPLSYLKPGDLIRISAGEAIPCDGKLESDLALADESLLTGESDLLHKAKGDMLFAGSMLSEPSINLRVQALGQDTRLSSVQVLLDQAIANKPKQQELADFIARYFVAAVLICFVCVFSAWYFVDSDRAFWVALSVLVVTCPCALSLATPAALAAGLNKLRRTGLLVVSPSALETLPNISCAALDKTGTLTLGELHLQTVVLIDQSSRNKDQTIQTYIEGVAALEHFSRHPIAKAFSDIESAVKVQDVVVHAGRGIQGKIERDLYKFGTVEFAASGIDIDYPGLGKWQLLSVNTKPVAWFLFADEARPRLQENLERLKQKIPTLSLLSGDRQKNIDAFIYQNDLAELFDASLGALLPEDKLTYVQDLQSRGEKVLMVGDGINDVPVLAMADLSVAMGSASQLAKVNADAVLLNQNLENLSDACDVAVRINKVIKQNFAWALGYNVLALPAAAMGFIPPYIAALGMSLSSLIVVLNSLRVSRK